MKRPQENARTSKPIKKENKANVRKTSQENKRKAEQS